MGAVTPPTLDGGFGTSGGDGAQTANHKVGEDLVGSRSLVGHVATKVGDLGALAGALEGRLVAVRGGRGGVLDGCRGGQRSYGDGRESRLPCHAPEADTRCVRQSRHRGL